MEIDPIENLFYDTTAVEGLTDRGGGGQLVGVGVELESAALPVDAETDAENQLIMLEDALVDALDNFKMSTSVNAMTEMMAILEMVGYIKQEAVYGRVNEGITLPTMLEVAQSDLNISRRCAALSFFQKIFKESTLVRNNSQIRDKLLSYWVRASVGCLVKGSFSKQNSESAVASKGVLAANAAIRPVMRSIAASIAAADDDGALRLFRPCMDMVSGVFTQLLNSSDANNDTASNMNMNMQGEDALRASCIKFLETIVLCFSSKGPVAAGRRRDQKADDFSLDDLPTGHPIITRDVLESIGNDALSTLRGLVEIGGQLKVENFADFVPIGQGDPSTRELIRTMKPAALAFLEVDAERRSREDEDPDAKIERKGLEVIFQLSQKSYAITLNAVAIVATQRPPCFNEAAAALARRAMDPPKESSSGEVGLSKAFAKGVSSQLRASCLTLLRNSLSVTSNSFEILLRALKSVGMSVQAEKALKVAKQQAALKTASRKVRNRAAVFYEWEQSGQERTNKRQRETDESLAKMRAAKVARGLGSGIQLPVNMIDACELALLNLQHLPKSRPQLQKTKKGREVNLDYIIDAVLSNGASLLRDESRWYDRNGCEAWSLEIGDDVQFAINDKTFSGGSGQENFFQPQCKQAAADAFSRVIACNKSRRNVNDQALTNFKNQLSARLAWTLKGVMPPKEQPHLNSAYNLAVESVKKSDTLETGHKTELQRMMKDFPLAASCLVLDYAKPTTEEDESAVLAKQMLYEAYMNKNAHGDNSEQYYALDILMSCICYISKRANLKPSDLDQKKKASAITRTLSQTLTSIPCISKSALTLISALCDIDAIYTAVADLGKGSISSSSAAHAATVAAEKRATMALLALRDVAFQRSKIDTQQAAVDCAVGIATGRFPSPSSIQDKALKLAMNVLYAKSPTLADMVVISAAEELERVTQYAIQNYEKVKTANEIEKEKGDENEYNRDALAPHSLEEKEVMENMKPAAMLYMALCVRRPEMIKTLMSCSGRSRADVLSKTVRGDMSKMARAAATAHGAANIALKVADIISEDKEIALLLAFLDNLSPKSGPLPNQSLIDACFHIQSDKLSVEGKEDPRFIIPVVSALPRSLLVKHLPSFISASDRVYKASLVRMSERLTRQATVFRNDDLSEGEDETSASMTGMTLCEQLVFLHRLDFASVGLPQKRYLDAIQICLEMDDLFTDRVILSALEYVSQQFLQGEKLPLAYMRTIIQTVSRHETLHAWICSELLPRLLEGRVYEDRRQWEGWMRCARMLESTASVSSIAAIRLLPEEQLRRYRSKYPEQ